MREPRDTIARGIKAAEAGKRTIGIPDCTELLIQCELSCRIQQKRFHMCQNMDRQAYSVQNKVATRCQHQMLMQALWQRLKRVTDVIDRGRGTKVSQTCCVAPIPNVPWRVVPSSQFCQLMQIAEYSLQHKTTQRAQLLHCAVYSAMAAVYTAVAALTRSMQTKKMRTGSTWSMGLKFAA